jgi:hypothetical protein
VPAHKCKRCWRNTRCTPDSDRGRLGLCKPCHDLFEKQFKAVKAAKWSRYLGGNITTPVETKPQQYPTLLTSADLSERIASLQRILDELDE